MVYPISSCKIIIWLVVNTSKFFSPFILGYLFLDILCDRVLYIWVGVIIKFGIWGGVGMWFVGDGADEIFDSFFFLLEIFDSFFFFFG